MIQPTPVPKGGGFVASALLTTHGHVPNCWFLKTSLCVSLPLRTRSLSTFCRSADYRTPFETSVVADKVRNCSILIPIFEKHAIAYVDYTWIIYIGYSKIIAGKIDSSKLSSFGLTMIGKVAFGKVRFIYRSVVCRNTEEYHVIKVAP